MDIKRLRVEGYIPPMSDSSDDDHVNDIILDEPMYYILTQFLETKDGKNIATVLEELVGEIRALRLMIGASFPSAPASAPAPAQSAASGQGSA